MNDASALDYAALADQISEWLREQRDVAPAKRFVIGLSGGVDSATVCALCVRAGGAGSVLGAIMPSHSNPIDAEHAALLASTMGIETVHVDLSSVTDALLTAIASAPATTGEADEDDRSRLAVANIRPRLRMTTLYYLANLYHGIVVGTGNRSEVEIGYFTKYGDGGVDLLPIVDLYKHEVRGLARFLGVPTPIIAKPPSAGLWDGQTDEHELGLTYDQLDATLAAIAAGATESIDDALLDRVQELHRRSAHKRQPALAFRRRRHASRG